MAEYLVDNFKSRSHSATSTASNNTNWVLLPTTAPFDPLHRWPDSGHFELLTGYRDIKWTFRIISTAIGKNVFDSIDAFFKCVTRTFANMPNVWFDSWIVFSLWCNPGDRLRTRTPISIFHNCIGARITKVRRGNICLEKHGNGIEKKLKVKFSFRDM